MATYYLDWKEGHGFRSDPESVEFTALNDVSAFRRAAAITDTALDDAGNLDKAAFLAAGAECLRRGGEVIFPLPEGIEFRIVQNSERPGVKLVEILLGGQVCAALYPQPDNSLKLVSAHFAGDLVKEGFPDGITMDNGSSFPPIPAILIRFDTQPYGFVMGRMIREKAGK